MLFDAQTFTLNNNVFRTILIRYRYFPAEESMGTRLWHRLIKIKVRVLATALSTQLVTSISLQSEVAAYWHGLILPQCIVQPSILVS